MKRRFCPQMVQLVGQSVGVDDISDSVAASAALDAEIRVRLIIQDALKYMTHGKRRKLSTQDIDLSLKQKNVQPVYGFSGNTPASYTQVENVENLFLVDTPTVTSESLLKNPIDRVEEPYFCVHWLAIQGQQNVDRSQSSNTGPSVKRRKKNIQVEQRVKAEHELSKEHQQYYEFLQKSIEFEDWENFSKICDSIRTVAGLGQLLPYLTQFYASTVSEELSKQHPRLWILTWMNRLSDSIVSSPTLSVSIHHYMDQVFSPLISCMVARTLCERPEEENHWELRDSNAQLMAKIVELLDNDYPELRHRITKVLAESLNDSNRTLTNHYGCIVGLEALGPQTCKEYLLPLLEPYLTALKPLLEEAKNAKSYSVASPPERLAHAWFRVVGNFQRDLLKNYKIANSSKIKFTRTPRKSKSDLEAEDVSSRPAEPNLYEWISEFFGDRLLLYTPSKDSMCGEMFI